MMFSNECGVKLETIVCSRFAGSDEDLTTSSTREAKSNLIVPQSPQQGQEILKSSRLSCNAIGNPEHCLLD